MGRKPCAECRAAFAPSAWDTEEDAARKNEGPPCAECCPELLPGNVDAWMIYERCQGQLIMSLDGPVDINVLAVLAVMELEGVENKQECLRQVQTLAQTAISEQRRERSEAQDDP